MMLISELQTAFSSPVEIVGHASYLLLIVSMMMRRMTTLRMVAIASGVLEIIYSLFVRPDPVAVFWETLFILVNSYQLAVLWTAHFRGSLHEDAEYFIQTVLPDVNRASARRAVKLASLVNAAPEERLTTEGSVAPALIFITDGTVQVEKSERIVAVCGKGDFLGEISFINGQPATADAVVVKPTRCLRFERESLHRQLDSDRELRHAMEASFNHNLSGKLAKSTDVSHRESTVPADS